MTFVFIHSSKTNLTRLLLNLPPSDHDSSGSKSSLKSDTACDFFFYSSLPSLVLLKGSAAAMQVLGKYLAYETKSLVSDVTYLSRGMRSPGCKYCNYVPCCVSICCVCVRVCGALIYDIFAVCRIEKAYFPRQ